MKKLLLRVLALSVLLAAGMSAFASEEEFDLDARFRAKLAKEKIRQGAMQRSAERAGKGIDNAGCGSQNIGNIDTGGRPGAAPREVFVFAPNAINLVTAGGCR
jgi:hypothetical protein